MFSQADMRLKIDELYNKGQRSAPQFLPFAFLTGP